MHLGISFTSLLASILVVSSGVQDATAAPARRGAGTITLPLKRLPQKRDGVHPHLYYQQHLNRGDRRLARMTRRKEPSHDELNERIERRHEWLKRDLERRGDYASLARIGRPGAALNEKNKKKHKGAAAAAAAGVAGAAAAGVAAASSSSSSAVAADGSTSGVSAIDLAALNDPALLTAANAPTASNSLGLAIEADDVGYVATVQIGTPPTNYNILMDSGSADFWVGNAENCVSEGGGGCGNHTFLGTSTSSSFVNTDQQFEVTYGSGAVAGTLCQDNVLLAGLALNNHTFGTANEESVQFSGDTTSFDGLMGLAQQGLSEQKVPTPVESLAQQKLINGAITSFKISRLSDQLNDGEVTFGGLDTSKFDQNTLVTFKNVNTEGFWEGDMTAVTVDGVDTGLKGRTAILDTGTTLIYIPTKAYNKLLSAAGGSADQSGLTAFSSKPTSNFNIKFGSSTFSLTPAQYLVPTSQYDEFGLSQGQYYAFFADGGSSGVDTIIGQKFLENYYSVFDTTNSRIGFATAV